jgi:hypothetical protein
MVCSIRLFVLIEAILAERAHGRLSDRLLEVSALDPRHAFSVHLDDDILLLGPMLGKDRRWGDKVGRGATHGTLLVVARAHDINRFAARVSPLLDALKVGGVRLRGSPREEEAYCDAEDVAAAAQKAECHRLLQTDRAQMV